jgi:putative addiction module killer protein
MKVHETVVYRKWFKKLRDLTAQAFIIKRIKRLKKGNRGDWGPVGEGLFELRIHYGPGYRMYCKETAFPDTGTELIILLCGGDKSTQQADIEKAKQIAGNQRFLESFTEENDGV